MASAIRTPARKLRAYLSWRAAMRWKSSRRQNVRPMRLRSLCLDVVGRWMPADGVRRYDCFCVAFGEPVARTPGVMDWVGNGAQRVRHDGEQSTNAVEVMSVAWGGLKSDGAGTGRPSTH